MNETKTTTTRTTKTGHLSKAYAKSQKAKQGYGSLNILERHNLKFWASHKGGAMKPLELHLRPPEGLCLGVRANRNIQPRWLRVTFILYLPRRKLNFSWKRSSRSHSFSYTMFDSQSKSAGILGNRTKWAKMKTGNRIRTIEHQRIAVMRWALK